MKEYDTKSIQVLLFLLLAAALTSPESTEDGHTDAFWLHITRTQGIDVVGITVAQKSGCLAGSINNKRPPTEKTNICHMSLQSSPTAGNYHHFFKTQLT